MRCIVFTLYGLHYSINCSCFHSCCYFNLYRFVFFWWCTCASLGVVAFVCWLFLCILLLIWCVAFLACRKCRYFSCLHGCFLTRSSYGRPGWKSKLRERFDPYPENTYALETTSRTKFNILIIFSRDRLAFLKKLWIISGQYNGQWSFYFLPLVINIMHCVPSDQRVWFRLYCKDLFYSNISLLIWKPFY